MLAHPLPLAALRVFCTLVMVAMKQQQQLTASMPSTFCCCDHSNKGLALRNRWPTRSVHAMLPAAA
jgi:hypothetical protein